MNVLKDDGRQQAGVSTQVGGLSSVQLQIHRSVEPTFSIQVN